MKAKKWLLAIATLLVTGSLNSVMAGQTCEPYTPTAEQLGMSAALATKTAELMDAQGRQAYIIGRIGQDLSEYGLSYSHLAIATPNPKGESYDVYHLLNGCGTDSSGIFLQGLMEFYSDDLYLYQGAILPLPEAVAKRLMAQLHANPTFFHEPKYSLTAYPYSTKYQNSNQWLLETLAGAINTDTELKNREQAQAWLKTNGFESSELKINTFKRLGGRMFKAQVAFDDHPSDLRYADRIQTTTAESIFSFIKLHYPEDSKLIELRIAQ